MTVRQPSRLLALALAALLLALPARPALAWGTAGHAIVAELAQRHLDPAVREKIRALLGGDASLASIAAWADTVALARPETRNWHFVNIPLDAGGYEAARDCLPAPGGDCIVAALARLRATLADPAAALAARAEALKFVVHLVADIHQPLHCAQRAGDAGGTTLMVSFFGARMSLHAVWDVGLIERRSYDWGEIVRLLERTRLAAGDLAERSGGEPAAWAEECHQRAAAAYAVPESLELGQDYFDRAMPVVEEQLALAGMRLARLLNEALR